MLSYAALSLAIFLKLNCDIIRNHSYVDISDIRSTDDTALLCVTNRPPNGANSGGDRFVPDGTRIPNEVVLGFVRNRGPMVMRLKRTTGTAAEGIYYCEVMDNTDTNQTVYVGIYNGGGMY